MASNRVGLPFDKVVVVVGLVEAGYQALVHHLLLFSLVVSPISLLVGFVVDE